MMPYQRKPIVDDGLGVNPGLLADVETMLEAAHKEDNTDLDSTALSVIVSHGVSDRPARASRPAEPLMLDRAPSELAGRAPQPRVER